MVTSAVAILGAGLAVAVSLLVIVPVLRNTCTLFNGQCVDVTYQLNDSGHLLIKHPVTGVSYWYDGQFIRSYGPVLPGTCDTSLGVASTGAQVPVGEPVVSCQRFDPSGECVSVNGGKTVPAVVDGPYSPTSRHTGVTVLEPAFVMNAYTLATNEQPVLCSRSRDVIRSSFSDVPESRVKLPLRDSTLDVRQLFEALAQRGVFMKPESNPAPPPCSGNGKVSSKTGLCVCDPGFTGGRCGTPLCKDDAACGSGTCNSGVCSCPPGWGGSACGLRTCTPACVNGQCDPSTGTCVCTPGYGGDSCDELTCVQSCVNGSCNPSNGFCDCDPGWVGSTCENRACAAGCGVHGVCTYPDGVCECESGWTGEACDTPVCPGDCNRNGVCDVATATCVCDPVWTGEACTIPVCPSGCCAHGTCDPVSAACVCDAGWSGVDCSIPDDPLTTTPACPVRRILE